MIAIFPDPESLNQAAAELFVSVAIRAATARGRFTIALSGGATPYGTYQLLAQLPYRDQVPWQKVHVFWGDERCVPEDDPRSNSGRARRTFFDLVPIPASQVHPIRCGPEPRADAARYESVLRAFFSDGRPRFDLVFLGLGENGHTLSLFPGAPVLEEDDRWVAEVYIAEEDQYRISLTAPAVNQASLVVFLVSGATKARVLHRVLKGPREPLLLPAQLIDPVAGELRWMVDRDAASHLKHHLYSVGPTE